MKKLVAASLLACVSVVIPSRASVLFSENFDSYNNGNLVGQGPWLQTGASATTPIQVSSGKAIVGTSGQDVYAPFSSGVYTIPDGTTFCVGLTLSLSAAQSAGDYFLHTTPTAGNSSTFVERVFAKSSGSGYVLGYLETAGGGGAVVNYGSTVLSFNTDYRVVVVYNAVAGTLNDTASLYVNPTDTSVEANNTPYISLDPWGSTSAESDAVAALNLRQGTAGNSPNVSVDNLVAGTLFGDVAAVPEPSSLALLGLGLVGGAFWARRKK